MSKTTISVIGTGYVGLTTAVLLAEAGYKVYAVDINPKRIEAVNAGKSFFYEEGIEPLIEHAVKAGDLIATSSYEDCIPDSQFVFSSVGTPDNPDGSSNLSFVFSAATEAAKYMRPGTIYIQKSTVPVGTGERIETMFKELKKDVTYLSNPEFLREGTAILDTLWFDRIVVGGRDKKAIDKVIDLYRSIEKHRDNIAARAGLAGSNGHESHYISTNRNSAELIKVTANAFLALKISFANSIAKLADHTGADINEVMDAVGADRRIGRAFLNAGRGYGGGCFPKDVSGLISSATDHGVDLSIMTAAAELNDTMPGYIANKAQEALNGSLENKKVAVLGLAFKAGTSDARRSPGVKLANILAHSGADVSVFDPQANHEAAEDLRKDIAIKDSLQKAVEGTDAVFITTDWPEFLRLEINDLSKIMQGKLFVDAVNGFDIDDVTSVGLQYVGVGRK